MPWTPSWSLLPGTSGTSRLWAGWEVFAPDARIQHLYTYSPLEPWQDRTFESVSRRVYCHALIDLAPEEDIDVLLLEIGRVLSQGQLGVLEQDESPQHWIGPKSARLLRSLFSARIPTSSAVEEDEAEQP